MSSSLNFFRAFGYQTLLFSLTYVVHNSTKQAMISHFGVDFSLEFEWVKCRVSFGVDVPS